MRIKEIIISSALFVSDISVAAFNEQEIIQLKVINDSSIMRIKESLAEVKMAVNSAILATPEKKDAILKLDTEWRNFAEVKCNYEIFESKGTDAEIAAKNDCLVKAHKEEVDYFNSVMP